MEIKGIKTFLIVAETLSFSRTAERLNFAQSTISDQIKLLENELGCKLFERLGRKICLTSQGEKFRGYAENIVSLCKEAKESMIESDEVAGELTVITAETLCVFKLPQLFKEYSEEYPGVDLKLQIGKCEEFHHMLRENKVDIAFALDDEEEHSDIISMTLSREPLVLIGSVDETLGKSDIIDISRLQGRKMILTQKGCGYRKQLEEYLHESEVELGSILEMESIEAIKQYVKGGFGLSFLPRVAVQRELDRGEIVEIKYDGPEFFIFSKLMMHKDKWRSGAIECMIEIAKKRFEVTDEFRQ